MTTIPARSQMVGWAIATVLILLASIPLPAEAQRLYRQKIDPDFGAPLTDLNWTGDGLFTVGESCFSGVIKTGWYNNFGSSGPCVGQIDLLTTDIFLTSISDPTNSVTLSFSSNPNAVRVYIDVDGSNKNVIAISGTYNAPLETTASWAVADGDDAGQYSLAFNGFDNNIFKSPNDAPIGAFARLTYCGRQSGYVSMPIEGECSTSSDPNVQISLVPEPSAYLLGLASFGVLGVWARRRRLNAR